MPLSPRLGPWLIPRASFHLPCCLIRSGDSLLCNCVTSNAPGLRVGALKSKGENTLAKKKKKIRLLPTCMPPRRSCGMSSFSPRHEEVEGSEVKMPQPLWLHEPFEPEIHPPCIHTGKSPGLYVIVFLFLSSVILIPPPPVKLYCELEEG